MAQVPVAPDKLAQGIKLLTSESHPFRLLKETSRASKKAQIWVNKFKLRQSKDWLAIWWVLCLLISGCFIATFASRLSYYKIQGRFVPRGFAPLPCLSRRI